MISSLTGADGLVEIPWKMLALNQGMPLAFLPFADRFIGEADVCGHYRRDFDIAAEHNKLKSASVGAIVTFTGTVRDLGGGEAIAAMTLEHYPGMTDLKLTTLYTLPKNAGHWKG